MPLALVTVILVEPFVDVAVVLTGATTVGYSDEPIAATGAAVVFSFSVSNEEVNPSLMIWNFPLADCKVFDGVVEPLPISLRIAPFEPVVPYTSIASVLLAFDTVSVTPLAVTLVGPESVVAPDAPSVVKAPVLAVTLPTAVPFKPPVAVRLPPSVSVKICAL
ncbi:hypothetical protein WJ09_03110 [Burkholderia vietnamiensis]|nr:hypothetical protein WJ09_03110 [Burkholderia vietnamiensis]